MTAIVGVINAQGIAIAADSAVTVTGEKGTKVYNNGNKLFTLSKYHPVGIAIYGLANFMGMPLETLIKMYRSNLGKKSFDKLEEYKLDFIQYLHDNLIQVDNVYKSDAFYSFCSIPFNEIKAKLHATIPMAADAISQLTENEEIVLNKIFLKSVEEYNQYIDSFERSATVHVQPDDFQQYYKDELLFIKEKLQEELNVAFPGYKFDQDIIEVIDKIFINVASVKNIFEASLGLVFVGFGDKEIYPSSQVVTVGSVIVNQIRYKMEDNVKIQPGLLNSNILPYVQGDVTWTVLNGVDPAYNSEVQASIRAACETIALEAEKKLIKPEESKDVIDTINSISEELISRLESYRFETITKPLLDVLVHMGKEDMAELAESLVNITSLKRKFTSTDSSNESVGGPVDVALITKGDGFIWMKRKHYFDAQLNASFTNGYFS